MSKKNQTDSLLAQCRETLAAHEAKVRAVVEAPDERRPPSLEELTVDALARAVEAVDAAERAMAMRRAVDAAVDAAAKLAAEEALKRAVDEVDAANARAVNAHQRAVDERRRRWRM